MRYRRDDPSRVRRSDELRQRGGDPPSPAETVLALQRSAGNQAVSALIARAPETAAPGEAKGAEAAGPRATLDGIGTIAIVSVNLGARGAGATGGRGGADRDEAPKEIVVTSRQGPHSPKLARATRDGTAMDAVIVLPRGKHAVTFTCKGAIVSSYAPATGGDGLESWTLDCGSITHAVEDEGSGRS